MVTREITMHDGYYNPTSTFGGIFSVIGDWVDILLCVV